MHITKNCPRFLNTCVLNTCVLKMRTDFCGLMHFVSSKRMSKREVIKADKWLPSTSELDKLISG